MNKLTKAQIKELDDCIELINKDYGKTLEMLSNE